MFQILALQNIETLNLYKVKKIVCTCPHCFNTLRNEYPSLGGNYEVLHHSQFLEQLLNDGLIKIHDTSTAPVTYHDSCYLGRINGVYEAPREVIGHLKTEIRELKRSRKNGLCCGAGGAQMFKEDEPGNKRINIERAGEVVASGSSKVVANCPFCITMLEDGIKSLDKQQEIMVLDLTELILENSV